MRFSHGYLLLTSIGSFNLLQKSYNQSYEGKVELRLYKGWSDPDILMFWLKLLVELPILQNVNQEHTLKVSCILPCFLSAPFLGRNSRIDFTVLIAIL